MYWQQRPNSINWIDQIRYFTDHKNELNESELRDAFINLAYIYTREFSNLKLLEDALISEFGQNEGSDIIDEAITETPDGEAINGIFSNEGDNRDLLAITLKMCDYIEKKWF